MLRKIFILFASFYFTLLPENSFCQIVTGEKLPSEIYTSENLDNILGTTIFVDPNKISEENSFRSDTALICGKPVFIKVDLMTAGTKILETDSFNLYQYYIKSNTSKALGVYFSDFNLPLGCKLFAYNSDKTQVVGAIVSSNNSPDNKFAIQPINGSHILIEYLIPKNVMNETVLIIDKIAYFYIDVSSILKSQEYRTDVCYKDVHCYTYDGIDRSVIKWVFYDTNEQSFYTCSGSILNQNVLYNDLKPYVYTANHCGNNADLSTAVFYFNYSDQSFNSNGGTTYYTVIGANQIAKKSNYDMFLMELYSTPPADYNLHYAGWDRDNQGDLFSFADGIHHPMGGKKAISKGWFVLNVNPNFHRIEWSVIDSPTSQGSSGSPLFEASTGRVIGDLSYGLSECDNLEGIDSYGKFRKQWNDLGDPDNRLKDWLDPYDFDPNNIDGTDPCFNTLIIQNRILFPASDYQPINKVTIQAGFNISTDLSVIIKTGSEYSFSAGGVINLKTGFHAEIGSIFSSSIASCTQIANNHRLSNSDQDLEIDSLSSLDSLVGNNQYSQNSINNFPNPFSSFTRITFNLINNNEIVSVSITDLYGKLLKTFTDNKFHLKGIYKIDLDANLWTAGTYFYTIHTPSYTETKKMIIIK